MTSATNAAPYPASYNPALWTITLDGHPVTRVEYFELVQEFGTHHRFILRMYHSAFETESAIQIDESRLLLGKRIVVLMGTVTQPDQTQFAGIVTGIKLDRLADRAYPVLTVTGQSPTIMLESGRHYRSFQETGLLNIVKEVLAPLNGQLDAVINPIYREGIRYSAQYGESHYNYLRRMAATYGEWMYYDGVKLVFGKPEQVSLTLQYPGQVDSFEMVLKITDAVSDQWAYDVEADAVLHRSAGTITPDGLSYYGTLSGDKSSALYKEAALDTASGNINYMGELSHATKVVKGVAAAQSFVLKGISRHPGLKPGIRLKLESWGNPVGEYLVQSVVHKIDDAHTYSCEFTALQGDLLTVPYSNIHWPVATPGLGTVVSNEDPAGMGRVKVQLHWQDAGMNTDWIRTIGPDAGGTGMFPQNRGYVFIPEVGDSVLVCYEGGHPERPYVMGSLFHGKNAVRQSNMLRAITTKSGHRIELDDRSEGTSIRIMDKSGNEIFLDTQGSNITITAPETMTLNAKNLTINVRESMAVNVGHNMVATVTNKMVLSSGNDLLLDSGKNIRQRAKEVVDIYGRKQIIHYAEKIDIGSSKTTHIYGPDTLLSAKDKIEYKAPEMNKVPNKGGFKYTQEPTIIDVYWMDGDMKSQIGYIKPGQKASIYVQTRNVEEGENIKITILETYLDGSEAEKQLEGTVDENGIAELRAAYNPEKA